MMAPNPNRSVRAKFLLCIQTSVCLLLVSCSTQLKIPSVVDNRVESVVRTEAARIVAVSEDSENFSKYQFFLSDFPRKDLLGMSVGNRRIYVGYKLASLALTDPGYQWLLRQTVAHEIGHETAGHAMQEKVSWLKGAKFAVGDSGRDFGLPWYVRVYNYSTEKELEADRKGMYYWNKLGWDCHIWVHILEIFEQQNYTGDLFHPTGVRLRQAQSICEVQSGQTEVRSTRSEIRNDLK
jgi:hypothetical protein